MSGTPEQPDDQDHGPDGDGPDTRSLIADAIAQSAAGIDGQGAMCTGWVLVAEWVSSDGEYWLAWTVDGSSPRWRSLGMMHATIAKYQGELARAPEPGAEDQ